MKTYQKVIILAAVSVLLAACANKKGARGADGQAGMAGEGVYSQGYGSGAGGMGEGGRGSTAICGSAGSNVLASYFFEYDKNDVAASDMSSVQKQANQVANHGGAVIRIEGNTDERGSREYNNALGWRRANAVAELMKQYGASPNQLKVMSYGSERPLVSGNDEQAFQCNRRVDLNHAQ